MLDNNVEKILIVRLSAIGDVIHSLPTAYALRQKYPNAQIDWLVEEQSYPLVNLNPYLDNVIILPRERWKKSIKKDVIKGLKSFFSFFKNLRSENYDITLDLQGLFKSAISSFFVNPDLRMGPADGREMSTLFYQAKIKIPNQTMHKIKRNLHLASALGAKTDKVNYGLKMTPGIKSKVSRLFEAEEIDKNKKLVAINPFTTWDSKNWFLERYFQLANELIKAGYYVIFIGDRSDREAIDSFIAVDKSSYSNLAGKTDLEELTEIINRINLLISGEGDSVHLAAALNLKSICLMGPTNPEITGPYGTGNIIIQDNSLECIRCNKKKCYRNMQCMKSITVEQIIRMANKSFDEKKVER